ncbi:MAG: hypothetical protein RhofKO_40190 [Rhodothermales bacterium]
MMRLFRITGVLLILLAGGAFWAQQRGLFEEAFYERSPFEAIRWTEMPEGIEVQVDDTWYALTTIEGRTTDHLIATSKRWYGERWQKRIDEDLPQVLLRMGWWPSDTVDLTLRHLESGEAVMMDDVAMTAENRVRIRAGRYEQEVAQLRERMQQPMPRNAMLLTLDAFETHLDERFAYAQANDFDYKAALNRIRTDVGEDLSGNDLGLLLQGVMAGFIDGHAGVRGFAYAEGALPFAIDVAEGGYVAFHADRSAFIDVTHPYVTALDEVPMDVWMEAGMPLVARGSSQYRQYGALRMLRRFNHLRAQLNLPLADSVRVTLANAAQTSEHTIMLPVVTQEQRAVRFPQRGSQLFDGNIGYLRLASMNDEAVEEIETWMPQFEQTDGLIIDVRGNTGGSRAALRALFPYVMTETDAPYVANAAKYRLNDAFDKDHLERRYMYRADSPAWNAAEREAIETFAQTFDPEWRPPEAQFSDWHYLVLTHKTTSRSFIYTAPIVILLDEKCFSATDIFLSAFKGWRNVTLVGQPSGGGSARTQDYRLDPIPLTVRMASMASFQRDGRFYDGHGIQPDVLLTPVPTDMLADGTDTFLDAALMRLRAP